MTQGQTKQQQLLLLLYSVFEQLCYLYFQQRYNYMLKLFVIVMATIESFLCYCGANAFNTL